jgi:restriction system protein
LAFSIANPTSPAPYPDLTWVIDLHQDDPRSALDVMSSYLTTHFWIMNDIAIDGIMDSMAIIRRRLTDDAAAATDLDRIRQLLPRELEYLVAALWKRMGHGVTITPSTRDGGRDVVATTEIPGQALRVFIECKQWSARVDVVEVRALLGALSDAKNPKGILVAPGGFTTGPGSAKGFAERNPQIELVDGPTLTAMMTNHFGENWSLRIDQILQGVKPRVNQNAHE